MRYFRFEALSISSSASIESIDSYEDNLNYYKKNNYSYVLMPFDGKYYSLNADEIEDIEEKQVVDVDTSIRYAIEILTEFPFLMIENGRPSGCVVKDGEIYFDTWKHDEGDEYSHPSELFREHPGFKQEMVDNESEGNTFYIVTAADLNKRVAKEMMYSVLADLENSFVDIIKDEFPNSEDLFRDVSPATIGRWQKAGLGDIQMHITEYMTLSEMQKIIAKSESLRSRCQFSTRSQFDKQMSGIVDLRNRVMHSSRTVIHDSDDVEQLRSRLDRVEGLIQNIQ